MTERRQIELSYLFAGSCLTHFSLDFSLFPPPRVIIRWYFPFYLAQVYPDLSLGAHSCTSHTFPSSLLPQFSVTFPELCLANMSHYCTVGGLDRQTGTHTYTTVKYTHTQITDN